VHYTLRQPWCYQRWSAHPVDAVHLITTARTHATLVRRHMHDCLCCTYHRAVVGPLLLGSFYYSVCLPAFSAILVLVYFCSRLRVCTTPLYLFTCPLHTYVYTLLHTGRWFEFRSTVMPDWHCLFTYTPFGPRFTPHHAFLRRLVVRPHVLRPFSTPDAPFLHAPTTYLVVG